ncbi:aromatic acid exporter family protein [Tuberibacillus sp. Marseille-P3662]|uniref:aromatic acid exporter family protein n=1 Tax=Tuberibacillus sp. Marseille-P3662 TaxID=1965358 RepID=UPI003F921061
MKIGIRTLKTAIGSGLAIFIAQLMGLQFYGSAGILTILCIEKTKVKSIQTMLHRSAGCLVGMVISGIIFEILGYHPLTFTLLIIILIPVLVKLRIQGGFITSIVIILHIYSLENISLSIVENELFLIIIGCGTALILNSFMPNLENELSQYQKEIEANFKKILYEYSVYLYKGDQGWNGEEMVELEGVFYQGKSLAIRNAENHILIKKDKHYLYFEMREKQFKILERMLPTISRLDEKVPQRNTLAKFFHQLSRAVKEENTAYQFLDRLNMLHDEMKSLPLPQSREEFETRASLFYLMKEMERYLIIKAGSKQRIKSP